MKAYVGQTRADGGKTALRLDAAGIGECCVRGELPPRRTSCGWFHDNGAFRDWQADRPFNCDRWARDMWCIRDKNARGKRTREPFTNPDFIVVPDKVACGVSSLEWSRLWRPDVPDGQRAYLAVQDGMDQADVLCYLREAASEGWAYAGIFVGGTLPWKLMTAAAWASFARCNGDVSLNRDGLSCHIGRVGTAERVHWAHRLGADSIDSCLPIMHEENLFPWLAAVRVCNEQPVISEEKPS